jgi:hypothetical protein
MNVRIHTVSCYAWYESEKYPDYVRLEVFTAVTMKNDVFWDDTDVSEESDASFIRIHSSSILVTLMKEALGSSETSVTSQKTFFIRIISNILTLTEHISLLFM